MNPETKILIVEDEALTRLRLRALLVHLGHPDVFEAVNGSEALKICEQELPGLMLTDLRMPEMDGFRLLAWMTAKFPAIPVIVISSVDTLQEAVEAFRHGAWDYLMKPIEDVGAFEVVINRALSHAALLIEHRQYQNHLESKVAERTHQLNELNEELEQRVKARTLDLEAANKELDAFCYSISHDLKAPLRSIDGFSKALLEEHEGKLEQNALHLLDRIQVNTHRMGQLIEDLLDLSRTSRIAIHSRKLNLSLMARKTLADLQQREPSRSVEIHIQEGMEAWGDLGLLRIVLENLLGNAWKYTSKTQAAVIALVQTHAGDGTTTIGISDNGAGFDMAHAGKLFGAFQRLHSSHEYEGTGIGLTIVQRIIHRHGGRIWAEAETGKGANFFFTLPDRGDL